MASYIVMEPADDRRGEAALFIKDAFRPLAVIVPVLWLFWNRLWFEAAMVFFASFILVGLGSYIGLPDWGGFATLLIGLYVALEGSALKIAAARRGGFVDEAVVDARSLNEAEEGYYFTREPLKDVRQTAPIQSRGMTGSGLFAMPGAH